MQLSSRAQAFQGKTVELTRSGIAVGRVVGNDLVVDRRTEAGERGTILRISDAGFSGLLFRVQLTTGEQINAYENDVKVVAR